MNGSTAHNRVVAIAAQPATHRAFQWLHLQERRIRQWQKELVCIPSPPFGEEARAAWFAERFRDLGLSGTHLDEAGNALAFLRPATETEPLVMLSAHLDTVFPAGTPVVPHEEDAVLKAPGACDNGAGLAGLLALAAALQHAAVEPATNILFAANVGEEAEGNLRGMRHLFQHSPLGGRIIASIALEGAGLETVVSRALGSRRFRITVTGPGGHAWTDAGTPNPIQALAAAVLTLSAQALSRQPRTSVNVGMIEGGTSVTSIPQKASALVDLRSTSEEELLVREVQLYRAAEDAVLAANQTAAGRAKLRFAIEKVGDRPGGELPSDSPLLATVRAVDRHLRLRTEERIGSTDANIPIALGREGIAIGAGGTAGGIHTTDEWYDSTGRELALRRVLLCLLDAAGEDFPPRLAYDGAARRRTGTLPDVRER